MGRYITPNDVVIRDPETCEAAKVVDGGLSVINDYPGLIAVDIYLYRNETTLTISSDTNVDDIVINVVSTAGLVAGEAITFYEGINISQNLIISFTATTVTISAPLDIAYTTAAIVECGPWNMAVDGSVTEQTFSVKAPPLADLDIHSISGSMLASTPASMDDGKFGGIAALTNGILIKYTDGIHK